MLWIIEGGLDMQRTCYRIYSPCKYECSCWWYGGWFRLVDIRQRIDPVVILLVCFYEHIYAYFHSLFNTLTCIAYRGYTLGQIPAGRLAHRHGAKKVFAVSILVPAILTLFMPIASETNFGLALFLRAVIGLFAAGNFPSVYHFFYSWVAPMEKTSMVAHARCILLQNIIN